MHKNAGPQNAIDGNAVALGYTATTGSTAAVVRAPALAGAQLELDRAYDDIVAVQVTPKHC